MTDVWSERAEAYRESDAHSKGRDLELFAEWAEGSTDSTSRPAAGMSRGCSARPASRSSRSIRLPE